LSIWASTKYPSDDSLLIEKNQNELESDELQKSKLQQIDEYLQQKEHSNIQNGTSYFIGYAESEQLDRGDGENSLLSRQSDDIS